MTDARALLIKQQIKELWCMFPEAHEILAMATTWQCRGELDAAEHLLRQAERAIIRHNPKRLN